MTSGRMSPDPTAALPAPDADALAHSARLSALIRQEIAANDGAIPFSRFMELALYAPGLGYYSAGARKFGEGGDFVTAPELGPIFAACIAESVASVLQQLGASALFFELGGGSGAFAEVALKRLLELDALPDRYLILEPSADLRERQRERLQQHLPPTLFELVEWLNGPLPDAWDGVLFANEVIDALPTPRFAIRDGEVYEEYVTVEGDGFARTLRPADAFLANAVRHVERGLERNFADGYRSEVLPQLPYWVQAVSGGMRRGAMLFVDYGHPRGEFYQADRSDGTLRAYYRHRMHDEPLRWPGLQDLTASVDFTALAEAGVAAGFDFAGYCSQASFLLGNGMAGVLERIERMHDASEQQRRRNEVKKLTLPSEMGERFQVMGFEKDVEFGVAFLAGDLSFRL
ncbi:class I SAM-dependent methyltransferase [Lysobacter yangpyeongensis]|uniref:Class I SAM-dependent methyltransferase n=1 Tax=Lysobacter yangpyeongensis TaxID=346182 RepID=A0ABW0SQG7_9GAMM